MKKHAIVAQSTENQNESFIFATFEDKNSMEITYESICKQGLRYLMLKNAYCRLEMAEIEKSCINIQMENSDLPIIDSVLKKGCYLQGTTQTKPNLVEVSVFFEETTDIFQIGFDFATQKAKLNQKTEVILENNDVVFAEEFLEKYDYIFHLGFAVGLQRGLELAGTETPNYID